MVGDGEDASVWTPVSRGRAVAVRIVATLVFVVASVFAFAQFFSGLVTRAELTSLATTGVSGHVYWVFAGLWVPLGLLGVGVVTMALWTVVQNGLVHRRGLRRILLAAAGATAFCLLGVLGVALSAPSPFLAYGWSALAALVLALGVCGLHLGAAQVLAPEWERRPAHTALR